MFKRYIVVFFSSVLLSMALCIFAMPQKAQAISESYSWSSYSKIGAKYGSYASIQPAGEGGEASVDFTQDKKDPNIFTAKPGTANCKGELRLTFSGTSNQATLSYTDCSPLADADKTVTIKNSDNITVRAQSDSTKMYDSFVSKNCKNPEKESTAATKRLAECKKAAKTSYDKQAAQCKNQYDYLKSPQLANKYLTCLAEKLCVDRPSETDKQAEPKDTKQQCTLGDVGWLVCQILYLESQLSDKSFELLTGFLSIDPLKEQVQQNQQTTQTGQLTPNNQNSSQSTNQKTNTQKPATSGNETTVFAAWRIFLGITNLIFVAVFLLVIFSYITGWGLSNYNIKSTLPRYIIAVLLVNLSFWICSLAIDISNVLGRTTQALLVDITPVSSRGSWSEVTSSVTATGVTEAETDTSSGKSQDESQDSKNASGTSTSSQSQPQTTAQCKAVISQQPDVPEDDQGENEYRQLDSLKAKSLQVGGALVFGAAVLYILLAVLIPLMTTALIAMIVTLLMLLLRQAVVIMLVVVSPVAFALIVLPNTRRWFDRWRSTFVTLLMIYPAISLIYGASYFAAHTLQDRALEYDSLLMSMFALAIMVVPLFMTPALMKLGGGIMDRFAGLINDKGPAGKLKSFAEGYQEDRKNKSIGRAAAGQGMGKLNLVRKAGIIGKQGQASSQDVLRQAKTGYQAKSRATQGVKNHEFASDAELEASAFASSDLGELEIEQTRAAGLRYEEQGYTHENYMHGALTGLDRDGNKMSDIERAAATQAAFNHASSQEAHDIIAASGQMNILARRALVDSMRKTGFTKENSHFGGGALNRIIEGDFNSHSDITNLMADAAAKGAYSGENLANQSEYTLSVLNNLKEQGGLNDQAAANLQRSSQLIANDQRLGGRLNQTRSELVGRLGR